MEICGNVTSTSVNCSSGGGCCNRGVHACCGDYTGYRLFYNIEEVFAQPLRQPETLPSPCWGAAPHEFPIL
jgi:hypothetical protein